ncbi:MAG: hypothetical protein WCG47_19955 [Dermatophilaceae bacterium]
MLHMPALTDLGYLLTRRDDDMSTAPPCVGGMALRLNRGDDSAALSR